MSKLYPYQVDGAKWLAAKKVALLADEMGLGKTIQAIRGLDSIHAKKVLVVAPSVARVNWVREFEKWSKVKRDYEIPFKLSDEPGPLSSVVCTFDYAANNAEKLRNLSWDALVVDEAHFLKSLDAKRARSILGKNGIVHAAKRCWLLTGTPAPNHPGELWIVLYTFGQTKLSYDQFLRRYCHIRQTQFGPQVTSAKTELIPELRKMLSPIMLRRLKKDVMTELPSISFHHCFVEPGPVDLDIQASFVQYIFPTDRRQELKQKLVKEAETLRNALDCMTSTAGEKAKMDLLAGIQHSVSTLRRYVGLQKCAGATEMLCHELKYAKAGTKIVVFAIHRDVIETLRQGLREYKPVVLYGQTPPEKRQKIIDKFQNNPKCRVFIGNIFAAGTAITLTAAARVRFVECDWVPGNNAQAIMRCHRIGQKEPVSVSFFLLDNSLDARINMVLKQKTRQLTQLFD